MCSIGKLRHKAFLPLQKVPLDGAGPERQQVVKDSPAGKNQRDKWRKRTGNKMGKVACRTRRKTRGQRSPAKGISKEELFNRSAVSKSNNNKFPAHVQLNQLPLNPLAWSGEGPLRGHRLLVSSYGRRG